MLKSFIFFIGYIGICFGALYQAQRETTIQPLGLLVVAMVLTPLIVAIFGGLSLNALSNKKE